MSFGATKNAHWLQRVEFTYEGNVVGFIEYKNPFQDKEEGHYLDWKNVAQAQRYMEIRCYHKEVDGSGNVVSPDWNPNDVQVLFVDPAGLGGIYAEVGSADMAYPDHPNYGNLSIMVTGHP